MFGGLVRVNCGRPFWSNYAVKPKHKQTTPNRTIQLTYPQHNGPFFGSIHQYFVLTLSVITSICVSVCHITIGCSEYVALCGYITLYTWQHCRTQGHKKCLESSLLQNILLSVMIMKNFPILIFPPAQTIFSKHI